jgi:hypothetical protein
VFFSTDRRKQKNFFLNLYHPKLNFPVTTDRHAYDIYVGIDSAVGSNQPVNLGLGDQEQIQDVINDVYREAARLLSEEGDEVLPNQVQAVTWEMWRILKREPFASDSGKITDSRGGWKRSSGGDLDRRTGADPFRVPERGPDGKELGENLVFELLMGMRQDTLPTGPTTTLSPQALLKRAAPDAGGVHQPDGSVVFVSQPNNDTTLVFGNKYPAVLGEDGQPRWVDVAPLPVGSVNRVRDSLFDDPFAQGEVYLNIETGDWPGLTGEEVVVLDADIEGLAGRWDAEPLGTTMFAGNLDRPLPENILGLTGLQHHLKNMQWMAISGFTNQPDGGKAATNAMFSELTNAGYHPVRSTGRYTDQVTGEITNEPSLLVFGVPPGEAFKFGRKYGQQTVLIPQGLLFTDTPEPRLNRDMVGIQVEDLGDVDITISHLPDGDVKWVVPWSDTPPDPVDLATLGMRRVRPKRLWKVRPKEGQNVFELATQLEDTGYTGLRVYSNQTNVDAMDWDVRFEHYYTDDVQTLVVTAGQTSAGPNVGHVYVPPGSSVGGALPEIEAYRNPLPDQPGVPQSNVVRLGPVELRPSLELDMVNWDIFDARHGGNRAHTWSFMGDHFVPDRQPGAQAIVSKPSSKTVFIEVEGDDIVPALRAKQRIEALGYDTNFELKVAAGADKWNRYGFPGDKQFDHPARRKLMSGHPSVAFHRDRPVDWFAEKHGFTLDRGFRVENDVWQLTDGQVASIDKIVSDVLVDFEQAFERFRFRGIKSRYMPAGQNGDIAWGEIEPVPGGAMFLNRAWMTNFDAMAESHSIAQQIGHLTSVDDALQGVVAHELGHVVHDAVRLSQNFATITPIDRKLRRLMGPGGAFAQWDISKYATHNEAEFVAEAFAQYYRGVDGPSELASEVVFLMMEEAGKIQRFRKA